MIKICQLSTEYRGVKLGASGYTLNRWGCLVCCLSMASDWFNEYFSPIQLANRKDLFYVTGEYAGMLKWSKLPFKKFRLEKKLNGCKDEEISESLKHKDKAVILQVNYSHFVIATRRMTDGAYYVCDPLSGKIISTRKANYTVTGSRHLVRC